MVYFNNRRSVADCLIRDISPYGARLIFSDTVTTPDTLDLYIPQKEQTLRAHVIWRIGHDVGVAFPQATQSEPAAPSGDLAERVVKLEAEIASIKRVLKKLKADDRRSRLTAAPDHINLLFPFCSYVTVPPASGFKRGRQ